jgi:hypothetical protein
MNHTWNFHDIKIKSALDIALIYMTHKRKIDKLDINWIFKN